MWLFPEEDPISQEPVDYFDGLLKSLGAILDQIMPERIEKKEQYNSLRQVAWYAKRAVRLQEQGKLERPFPGLFYVLKQAIRSRFTKGRSPREDRLA